MAPGTVIILAVAIVVAALLFSLKVVGAPPGQRGSEHRDHTRFTTRMFHLLRWNKKE